MTVWRRVSHQSVHATNGENACGKIGGNEFDICLSYPDTLFAAPSRQQRREGTSSLYGPDKDAFSSLILGRS